MFVNIYTALTQASTASGAAWEGLSTLELHEELSCAMLRCSCEHQLRFCIPFWHTVLELCAREHENKESVIKIAHSTIAVMPS